MVSGTERKRKKTGFLGSQDASGRKGFISELHGIHSRSNSGTPFGEPIFEFIGLTMEGE
jgi:hypothetical protein